METEPGWRGWGLIRSALRGPLLRASVIWSSGWWEGGQLRCSVGRSPLLLPGVLLQTPTRPAAKWSLLSEEVFLQPYPPPRPMSFGAGVAKL